MWCDRWECAWRVVEKNVKRVQRYAVRVNSKRNTMGAEYFPRSGAFLFDAKRLAVSATSCALCHFFVRSHLCLWRLVRTKRALGESNLSHHAPLLIRDCANSFIKMWHRSNNGPLRRLDTSLPYRLLTAACDLHWQWERSDRRDPARYATPGAHVRGKMHSPDACRR
jgi:hypothetical protein